MRKFFLQASILLMVVATSGSAAVPPLMNYQGNLYNADSTLTNGTVSITFTIYDTETGGNVIWTETQESVKVKDGLFRVLLGSIAPLADVIFDDSVRFLGIKVGSDPEMAPRTRIGSVGFALRVGTIDGAKGGAVNSDLMVTGKVGIGTDTPIGKLTVQSPVANTYAGYFQGNGTIGQSFGLHVDAGTDGSDFAIRVRHVLNGKEYFAVRGDGNVGIGTNAPSCKLTVQSPVANNYAAYFQGNGTIGQSFGVQVDAGTDASDFAFRVRHVLNSKDYLAIRGDGNVGIGTASPSTALDVSGTITTSILAITGGSDLAEPFETNGPGELPAGSIVIIDDEDPGKLRLSESSYDTRVAGVISGAGGINPGLTLKQFGVIEGSQNVALSGRVYVLATSKNGSIKPGDLLTTSDIPGHAMKAADRERSHGAVIGKAMSVLDRGEGLVLVLVNLQ